jgi:hypothetical protein
MRQKGNLLFYPRLRQIVRLNIHRHHPKHHYR